MTRPRALEPSEVRGLLAGLAIQPLLTGGLAFVSFPMLLLDRRGRSLAGGFPEDVTDAALAVALGTAIVAVFVSLVCVLPTAAWLMPRRRIPLRETLLFGFGFGNLPFVVGTALAGAYGINGFVRGVAFSTLLGLAGSAAFWAIALRGQQPRSKGTTG